jgi:organic hydroperoxide reductase OsmC/OhrA
MSKHVATIAWQSSASPAELLAGKYSREHTWTFDGGTTVPASSSPSVVPAPWSIAANVDPEEAYVASIASCHMLTFLYVAAKQGFVVDDYADDAVGEMSKNERGKFWVSKVTLSPQIKFSGEKRPSSEQLNGLHHLAHEECYIANSVKSEVVVQGAMSFA